MAVRATSIATRLAEVGSTATARNGGALPGMI